MSNYEERCHQLPTRCLSGCALCLNRFLSAPKLALRVLFRVGVTELQAWRSCALKPDQPDCTKLALPVLSLVLRAQYKECKTSEEQLERKL